MKKFINIMEAIAIVMATLAAIAVIGMCIIMVRRSEGCVNVKWTYDPVSLNSYPDPVVDSADW